MGPLHIARQPVSPSERVIAVPIQLSAIVMRLLAKTAEERYQPPPGSRLIFADAARMGVAWTD